MKGYKIKFCNKYNPKQSAFFSKNFSIKCKQLRALLALSPPIILPNGNKVIFLNKLSYFNTMLYIDSIPPTVEQLTLLTNELKIDGQFLCPMLVWATKDGVPTLVKIQPGSNKPVKIVKTPSLHYLAYSILIVSTETEGQI